jgi:glycosyltransferase involved in cell wall biosynthesis
MAAGEAPDTGLWGQNHLRELGVDAVIRDSALRRSHLTPGLRHRVTWHARELVLPFELRDVDVVVTPLATVLPLTSRVVRGPKILVVSYHLLTALDRSGPLKRFAIRQSLASAAGVVTISTTSRDRLLDRTGLDPEKVSVVHLGVDDRWWQPLPPSPDGHVLAVGRDLARDYATLARAVDGLDRKTVIVAKEENLRGVQLPANVDVRSNIQQDELLALYAGASCIVVPLVSADDPRGSENSGTTALLEGMASAKPTIVTTRPFLDDYVDKSATATVPPGDPDALRTAISAILDDPSRAQAMGLAGRALVETRFTTRRFAEQLASIIEAVA